MSIEKESSFTPILLGITQQAVNNEMREFDAMALNLEALSNYSVQTLERIKSEHPLLWFDLSKKAYDIEPNLRINYGLGISRAYNLLPERHKNKVLLPDDIDCFRARLKSYKSPDTGVISLSSYFNDLIESDEPFAKWLLMHISDANDQKINFSFSVGALITTLPFFIRDETKIARGLLSY